MSTNFLGQYDIVTCNDVFVMNLAQPFHYRSDPDTPSVYRQRVSYGAILSKL